LRHELSNAAAILMEMERSQAFTSGNGATISYRTVGSGPAVIVIPGVLSIAADFDTFADVLAESFTVHTIERRGRGYSSPQDSGYCMAIERADVIALQEKTRAAFLFGHSYGGLIALETARNNALVKKVAVYEPGISVNGSIPTTWASKYERLLVQNKQLDAFVEFSAAVGPARARNTPRWLLKLLIPLLIKRPALGKKLNLLESNLREHQEIARLDNTYENYREVSADVLLLSGGKSDLPWVAVTVAKLSDVLPAVRVKQFPSLNHFGPDRTGPREVAQAVKTHFTS
jgi:pimeloyl-ACP methyl ester carboxylesterase